MSFKDAPTPKPVVAIYRVEEVLRRTIECTPSARFPGCWTVDEPIDAADGETVVIAYEHADLKNEYTVQQLTALRERGFWPPTKRASWPPPS